MIDRYSRSEISKIWTDEERFKLWLDVEIIALEAMVAVGIAPEPALKSVQQKARFSTERIQEIEGEVKHDVVAFLTNVAEEVGEDARYLHLGMTSADLLDTSFAVQLCRATDIILKGIDELLEAIRKKAYAHKNTPCVGRSHGVHAQPTTFGLKLAGWYAELKRDRRRIENAREDIAVGAISGPVGTFSYLSPSVEAHVCKKLGLRPAAVSAQIIQRDSHAALFSAFAVTASTLERIATEIRHLQRTEVREVEEYFSKGQKGSIAMPHKRNPVLSENICGLARLVRAWAQSSLENVPLWHERDISHSSVERVIAPDCTITLDFMLARTIFVINSLRVYPHNMQKNLEMTQGLIYSGGLLVALTEKGLTRERAYILVQEHALATWEAFNEGRADGPTFIERVRQDPEITSVLSDSELNEVFSLERHLKQVDVIFDRVFNKA